jgi:hypothetical protein
MVDFDELRGKAESLLGEHSDQVEGGIDKLADLAGKQFGHAGQIDAAAGKLKDFVTEQDPSAQRPSPGAKKPPAKKVPPAKKAVGKKTPGQRPRGNRPGRPQPN